MFRSLVLPIPLNTKVRSQTWKLQPTVGPSFARSCFAMVPVQCSLADGLIKEMTYIQFNIEHTPALSLRSTRQVEESQRFSSS
jgi:hypothetical protein